MVTRLVLVCHVSPSIDLRPYLLINLTALGVFQGSRARTEDRRCACGSIMYQPPIVNFPVFSVTWSESTDADGASTAAVLTAGGGGAGKTGVGNKIVRRGLHVLPCCRAGVVHTCSSLLRPPGCGWVNVSCLFDLGGRKAGVSCPSVHPLRMEDPLCDRGRTCQSSVPKRLYSQHTLPLPYPLFFRVCLS